MLPYQSRRNRVFFSDRKEFKEVVFQHQRFTFTPSSTSRRMAYGPQPRGEITWKRAKLAGRDFSHLPVKAPRIEQAIADDVAFLATHPTRTKKSPTIIQHRVRMDEHEEMRIPRAISLRTEPKISDFPCVNGIYHLVEVEIDRSGGQRQRTMDFCPS
jgi:hypothetical protein